MILRMLHCVIWLGDFSLKLLVVPFWFAGLYPLIMYIPDLIVCILWLVMARPAIYGGFPVQGNQHGMKLNDCQMVLP